MSNAFRKGVQYNMKIVLRGDVMTGKTNLFHRLQGAEFDDNYTSTSQIQVANIPWRYKDSNDIVKIEVWDVVDNAHNKSNTVNPNAGIKLEHRKSETTLSESSQQQKVEKELDSSMGLDATTVNVYRNTHAIILMFDISKPWTFDYVNKELDNVPGTMSILVLGNFCDKIQERKVDLDTIHTKLYQHNQKRIEMGAIKPNLIRYAEASMQTGLGLKYVYEYFGVPFLQLMIESLNKQLELKAVEIVDLLEVLDTDDNVPDEMHRRRGQDNFVQPNEPRLAREHEEMKSVWDQDLEAIAMDHPTILDEPISVTHQESPRIPTEPVKKKMESDIQLVSDEVPAIDIGDELTDDWFGEDSGSKQQLYTRSTQNETDDEGPGNPMVLGDEDIEPTLFYKQPSFSEEQKDTENNTEEQQPSSPSHQPPLFKSDLSEVWSRGLSVPEVVSDSEDEDNVIHRVNSMSLMSSPSPVEQSPSPFMESPSFNYEEIRGEQSTIENPWSITATTSTADNYDVVSDHHVWSTNDEGNIMEKEEKEKHTSSKKKKATKKKKRQSTS
ncbi:MAG: P-loop containing nucleoside triphosphate hydrolase protein [Benjaminiella poitrasii]|nr:MAG: P-loop containing nucleoside triphosphate hydrolase protein [Benjaminiella poitrasii]